MSQFSVTHTGDKSVLRQPSETAMSTATMRALATYDEREEIRGGDYLAELFLSGDRKAPLKDPAIREWILKNKVSPGVYEFMIARTAFFDQVVKDALLQGLTQLVLLGAGYDSRPYRFRELAQETKIFELDAAPTQGQKYEVLERGRIPMPPHHVFVPIDFNRENLGEALTAYGFSSLERALFVWEGVMYYLSAEVVDRTLAAVRNVATAGSEICLHFSPWLAPKRPCKAFLLIGCLPKTWQFSGLPGCFFK